MADPDARTPADRIDSTRHAAALVAAYHAGLVAFRHHRRAALGNSYRYRYLLT